MRDVGASDAFRTVESRAPKMRLKLYLSSIQPMASIDDDGSFGDPPKNNPDRVAPSLV